MNRPRQRIRKEETQVYGNGKSYTIESEEHSVFLDDGNILSRQRIKIPATQGMVPNNIDDIVGQCQSCSNFLTKKSALICDLCWQVVCLPCATIIENKTVCPSCAKYLEHRRWILILRKLLIEPFIERLR